MYSICKAALEKYLLKKCISKVLFTNEEAVADQGLPCNILIISALINHIFFENRKSNIFTIFKNIYSCAISHWIGDS